MSPAAIKLKAELFDLQLAAHNKTVRAIEAEEEQALAREVQKLKGMPAAAQPTSTDPADALRAQLRATKCPREAGRIAAQLNALRT